MQNIMRTVAMSSLIFLSGLSGIIAADIQNSLENLKESGADWEIWIDTRFPTLLCTRSGHSGRRPPLSMTNSQIGCTIANPNDPRAIVRR
jgi:hypothetical protein